MNFLVEETQETMDITDIRDKTIPIDIFKAIIETTNDQLIASRYTIQATEAKVDSKIIHAIVLTAHAHQATLALYIDFHAGIMNIPTLTYPYAKCHVSYELAHSIHLQIANVPLPWNKSR